MSGLITVIRGGAKGAPKKAPTFFSRVDEAAQELPRTKGTGKEFMAELKKQPGVKKAELDDRKLSSLESAPKMTKEEFVKKLNEKPAPKIEETFKANPTDADLDARAMELIEKKAEEMTDDRIGRWHRSNSYEWLDYKEGAVQYLKDLEYDKYLREAKRDIEENGGVKFTKYEGYKLPGGENYREILLRLPSNRPSIEKMGRAEYNAAIEAADKAGVKDYTSSHWDEPNVLAHMRVQDRVGPNGEKILHVEEIQSDWHQEGRKKGYRESAEPMDPMKAQRMKDKIFERFDAGEITREQRNALLDELSAKIDQGSKVPDAPFKKNWHELATKRIMDYAIQNGYDKVAITPGAEQASRYDLSKHIDSISYDPEIQKLEAWDKNRKKVLGEFGVEPAGVEHYVGKDVAKKLFEASPVMGKHLLEGQDLQVGGEGMKGFYDKIIPNYLTNEYGKYGASVGRHEIPVPPKDSMAVQEYTLGPEYISGRATWDELLKANPSLAKEYAVPLHSIDITPQMREAIEAKGQPLYQAVGIGLTGAAAVPEEQPEFRRGGRVKLSDNPDTMMLELLSRRK